VSGQLTMYTTQWCGFCRNLKRQLARDGIEMAEVDIERDEAPQFVLPLVVRVERAEPPARTDALETAALELAHQVASASPLTLRIGKHAFYRQIDAGQDQAYELMSQTMAENAMTCDAQEGMSAFLEKRTPTWRGE